MINPALAFTLVALAMLVVNNGYADEKSAIDVKVVEFTKAEIASDPDDVVPESKASIAQENSLKQPDNKVVNVSDAKPKRETDLVDGLILNRAMTRFGHRLNL